MIKDKSIFIKNIYYMLSYAFSSLQQLDYEHLAKENFENIHNLFAAILAKGISRQLKQGLYREYKNQKDDLPVMRGKIDLQGTIKNKLKRKHLLSCEFDELSENNQLNQILKTTVILLIGCVEVESFYKKDLKKEMLFFSNVDVIEPKGINWSAIRFHRNNQSYRVLLSICQLVLEGMLLTTEHGEYKFAKFLDDQRMCRLYEKFILEYYIKEHQEIKAKASQIPWALDDGVGTLLPIMQSDITLENKTCDKVLIIDAKYYTHTLVNSRFDNKTLHSANLYQIFTYVKNREAGMKDSNHTVSGMLLYAKTDSESFLDNSYQMSGNKISVRTLDLNSEFSKIRLQLDDIVKEHFAS